MNLPPNRAAWPARWKEAWEERAGIMEFSGNLDRFTAETRAELDIRKQAAQESKSKERTAWQATPTDYSHSR